MSIAACADLVARGDPDRFAATMAAPQAARPVLFPLYAFNIEVSRAPWLSSEPMIAEMRLQWWYDVLGEIAVGAPPRRHEVVTPLAGVLDPAGARLLQPLVEARRWDIYRDPFSDEAALIQHLETTGGTLMWAAARALGGREEAVYRDIGFATALAGWLRAIPELEARGRVPLVDGRPDAVAALARVGLARLGRGRLTGAGYAAGIAGWQTRAILRRAAGAPGLVAAGALQGSEFARRGGLLRAAFLRRI